MASLVHELISDTALRSPDSIAVHANNQALSYAQLERAITSVALAYSAQNISQGDRVGVYLAKNHFAVQSMFACSQVGAVFVPINPVLKAPQVKHIAQDCQLSLLVINYARLKTLLPELSSLTQLKTIIVIDADEDKLTELAPPNSINLLTWQKAVALGESTEQIGQPSSSEMQITKNSLAAILYTSGSTGKPKGIMLSHHNIVLGAKSVSQYLKLTAEDIILAVLPLSFDYGLNQLTSAFLVGAQCILLDYLLPNDVIKAVNKFQVTGLAAVPPLWAQLTQAKWPENGLPSIRYFTNSGGAMPLPVLKQLQQHMPNAEPFLMYGLTEAFRSTYLPPEYIAAKPSSMGKAIPNAEVFVVREDGTECDIDEEGELVHVGPLVSLGYWQNNQANSERFKTPPSFAQNLSHDTLAVFSGDYVKKDSEGFLYFIARKDAMIKTSGYRVSPGEIEAELIKLAEVTEVAIIAKPSEQLGQEIVAVVATKQMEEKAIQRAIIKHCQLNLPNYMAPKTIIVTNSLPRNSNNKVDYALLKSSYGNLS